MNILKKICHLLLMTMVCLMVISGPVHSADYNKRLSKEQKNSLCEQLKNQRLETTQNTGESLGGGIIPDNVLTNIYATTNKISNSTALAMVMGHALTCHAVHAGKNSVKVKGIEIFDYPDFSVWLCGGIIYFVGFMMTLSITFYIADIAFKLGFAVIMLPIGVALWPFPLTNDKLSILISIILKNAAIFAFLAITASYALNLLSTATGEGMNFEPQTNDEDFSCTNAEGKPVTGMECLFMMIDNNQTDFIAESFTLFSSYFLVLLVALIYGLKLIGATIPDYVDKFFPDKAFSNAAPIHGRMTQGMDFVKKKTVDPVMSFAKDVASTQAGNVLKGTGNLVAGKYNSQIKNYLKNPGDISKNIAHSVHKFGGNIAKGTTSALTGTVGRVLLGKEASQDLQEKISDKIDKGTAFLDKQADSVAQDVNNTAHDINNKMKNYLKNPGDISKNIAHSVHSLGGNIAKGTTSALTGTVGRVALGKEASRNLQNKINKKIDQGTEFLNKQATSVANSINDVAHSVAHNVNQVSENIQQAHDKVQNKYENSLDSLKENRKDISYKLSNTKMGTFAQNIKNFRKGNKKFREQLEQNPNIDMNNLSDKDYRKAFGFSKAVDRKTNNIIQKRNERRDNVNNAITKFRKNIDKVHFLAKNKNDGTFKAAAKWTGRMALKTLKPALAVADGVHRVANGAVTLGLNVTTSAVGGITKLATNTGARLVETPFNVVDTIAKVPNVVAEGGLRALNVTKHAKHIKNATKSGLKFTGEVLAQTGDQMGRNAKSAEQLAREAEEKRKRQEEYEKEKRKNGEW